MWCVLQDRQIKIEVLYQSKFPPQGHKICCSGSPSDQFVTFLLLIHRRRICQRHYFAIGQLYFFGSQSGVQCLTVGRLQHSLGEGPEQGSAGTKWGSRTSSPSREAFSGAPPPFVTDDDGWLGRPRGTCKGI